MVYTVGEMAKMLEVPASTLRYYDKEGLFPEIKRSGGIRHFDTTELEALRLVECLKTKRLLRTAMRTESMKCCRIACRKKFRHTMMPHIQTDSDRNF